MKNTSAFFSSCSIALKEWACVVECLGQGAQSLIIRKGGIHEKNGVFEPEHGAFALFPTYEHQKAEDLNATGRHGLEVSRLKTGLSEPGPIPLNYLAKVQHVFWMARPEWIALLAAQQALNAQSLEKRFQYGERAGFYILVLRVYRLEHTVLLPHSPAYAGCRSWITLVPPLEAPVCEPVLSESDFAEQTGALVRFFGK